MTCPDFKLPNWMMTQSAFLTIQKTVPFSGFQVKHFSLFSPSSSHSLLTLPHDNICSASRLPTFHVLPHLIPRTTLRSGLHLLDFTEVKSEARIQVQFPRMREQQRGEIRDWISIFWLQVLCSFHQLHTVSHVPELHVVWQLFILLLHYFLILEVLTFIETQSNLRKAKVQLFLSANSSPKSGTPIICLQGTLEQLDLEQKPSSTTTANNLGTGWKTSD